ncbi:sugar phosphate isomerase/epimerase family protein [Castellaniella defragrans]|uniref:Sugar phosphate isomerase/epimerase n=1 Tax=Castellaniella defragrans TaxID=75697 RepID=A0A7W9WQ95_CASDE|nr:sugar phosphate isomerase/epimerase family protein [Castellaniella defragrans]KAB0622919.1 sugar phosphate isomerase/epimerase [Castellaniella defragrans]MBB6085368.1 sugar phosphate isomerase/epimerase [Castellaniella defragrans]
MSQERFGIDLACMAGSLEERLRAAEAAGFSQVMLWARDLANHPEGYETAVRRVRESGLEITGLQLMRDYEGMNGPAHRYKLDVAKALLEICADVGAPLLIVSASAALPRALAPERAEADLRKLANLAVPTGVRIGFKAIPWSHTGADIRSAWDLVCRAAHANLGLVLDAFHFIAEGSAFGILDEIPPDRIVLVQLADFGVPALRENQPHDADRMRVFPGDGVQSDQVAALVRRLDGLDYEGSYSLLVFNKDYRQLPAHAVARLGIRSVGWIHDQALRRRLPLRRAPAR